MWAWYNVHGSTHVRYTMLFENTSWFYFYPFFPLLFSHHACISKLKEKNLNLMAAIAALQHVPEISNISEATTYEIKLALTYLRRVYLGRYVNAHSRTYFCKEALEELSVLEWRVGKGMLWEEKAGECYKWTETQCPVSACQGGLWFKGFRW